MRKLQSSQQQQHSRAQHRQQASKHVWAGSRRIRHNFHRQEGPEKSCVIPSGDRETFDFRGLARLDVSCCK